MVFGPLMESKLCTWRQYASKIVALPSFSFGLLILNKSNAACSYRLRIAHDQAYCLILLLGP